LTTRKDLAMASQPAESEEEAARTAAAQQRPVVPSRAYVVPEGKLPVSEFASDRSGAGSPFGDDLSFPLPVERLTYTHPSEDTTPSHQ
jgi:succinate dehydrogenase / fumarate reductase iron-sulfur subunit